MSTQSSNYQAIKAISNSLLGLYEENFKAFVNYWVNDYPIPQKKEGALTLGSAIDTLLTRPNEFNDKFIVYNALAPTGLMLNFCNALAEIDGPPDFKKAYEAVGFKRDPYEKVVENFSKYRDYYDFLTKSKSRVVLTAEQASIAQTVVSELRTSKYTKGPVNQETDKEGLVDVFHQLEIVSTYVKDDICLPVKGALDKVTVDHLRKTIYPFDYKSSFNSENFEESYYKWKYFRQGSFYRFLLENWKKEKGWEDYKIAPFVFIVCSTNGGAHSLWQMSSVDTEKAEYGGTLKNDISVKGWRTLLDEIAWLTKNNNWSYSYIVQKNKGIVPLNIFKND